MSTVLNMAESTNYQLDSLPFIRELIRILVPMCGPRAAYTLRFNVDSGTPKMEWTNDGISILKSLRVGNTSIHRALLASTGYVGSRINAVAHDGTTTSMLVFLSLLETLIKYLNPVIGKGIHIADSGIVSLNTVTDAFKEVSDELLKFLSDRRLTVSDLINDGIDEISARKIIAKYTAFISSKGNEALSDAIAEVVSKTSSESSDAVYQFSYDNFETHDLKVVPIEREGQLTLQIATYNETVNNADLATRFVSDAVNIFPFADTTRGSPQYEEFYGYLKQKLGILKSGQDVDKYSDVFITHDNFDPTFSALVDDINKLYKSRGLNNRIVTILLLRSREFSAIPVVVLSALIGAKLDYEIGGGTIKDIGVKIGATSITFFNLYPDNYSTDEHHVQSWLYANKHQFEEYNQVMAQLTKVIKAARGSHSTGKVIPEEINRLEDLYQQLTCRNTIRLHVSGMSTDIQSVIPVIEDACGSALAAVSEGVIVDGFSKMLAYLESNRPEVHDIESTISDIMLRHNCDDRMFIADMEKEIYSRYMNSQMYLKSRKDLIKRLIRKAYKETFSNIFCYVFGSNNISLIKDESLREQSTMFKTAHFMMDREGVVTHSTPEIQDLVTTKILMQPWVGFEELFMRLNEIIPKYLRTINYVQSEDIP